MAVVVGRLVYHTTSIVTVPNSAQKQTFKARPYLHHPQPQLPLGNAINNLDKRIAPPQRPTSNFLSDAQVFDSRKVEKALKELTAMSPGARARAIAEARQIAANGQARGRTLSNSFGTFIDSRLQSSPQTHLPPGWTPNGIANNSTHGSSSNGPGNFQQSSKVQPSTLLPHPNSFPVDTLPPQGRPQSRYPPARRPVAQSAKETIAIDSDSDALLTQKSSKRKRLNEPSSEKREKPTMSIDHPKKKLKASHGPKKGLTPNEMSARVRRENKEKEEAARQLQSEQKWARELRSVTDKAIAKIRIAGAASVVSSGTVRGAAQPTRKRKTWSQHQTSSRPPQPQHPPTTHQVSRAPMTGPNHHGRIHSETEANVSEGRSPTVPRYPPTSQLASMQPPYAQHLFQHQPFVPKRHPSAHHSYGPPSGGPSSDKGLTMPPSKKHRSISQPHPANIGRSVFSERVHPDIEGSQSPPLNRKRQREHDEQEKEPSVQKKAKTSDGTPVLKVPQLPAPIIQPATAEKPTESLSANCSHQSSEVAVTSIDGVLKGPEDVVDPTLNGCIKNRIQEFPDLDIDEIPGQVEAENSASGPSNFNLGIGEGPVNGFSGIARTLPDANEPETFPAFCEQDDLWDLPEISDWVPLSIKENIDAAPEVEEAATKEMRQSAEKIAKLVPNPVEEFGLMPIVDWNKAHQAYQ